MKISYNLKSNSSDKHENINIIEVVSIVIEEFGGMSENIAGFLHVCDIADRKKSISCRKQNIYINNWWNHNNKEIYMV